jgi:outer membrane lipoprotein SlyB
LKTSKIFEEIMAMNDPKQPHENDKEQSETSDSHPIATGLGAVGGGVAGAAIGGSVGGKFGAALGSIAGAIAGGIAGNAVADVASEAIAEIQPAIGFGLGANGKPVELPKHYTWEELQALSKPQG